MFAAPVWFQTDAVPAYACVEATMKAVTNIETKTILIKSSPHHRIASTYNLKNGLHGHRSHFLKKSSHETYDLRADLMQCAVCMQPMHSSCIQAANSVAQHCNLHAIKLQNGCTNMQKHEI